MPRSINRLTTRQVASLRTPGRHADGGGLYLRIVPAGSRSWVFLATARGKRVEIGLGSANALPLAKVREIAAAMREAVASGADPRTVLNQSSLEGSPAVLTFSTFAEEYISSIEAGWKNATHRQQWRNSLRDHAQPLRDMPIDQIDTDLVLQVLRPIWLEKPETAARVRGRIERILDAAKARGLRGRESLNPAALRGHLALLLPKQRGMIRGHHRALPYMDLPPFMGRLRERVALTARCLEFTILTAARSGEALGATWGEIDAERALWTIPGSRMKAGQEHAVPLTDTAMTLLEKLRPTDAVPTARIFAIDGAARSNMAMTMLLRRMKVDNATVHGFRSSFRDWAGDHTNYPRELIEQALAHTVSSKVERAYRRSTAIERRRDVMEDWSRFLNDITDIQVE